MAFKLSDGALKVLDDLGFPHDLASLTDDELFALEDRLGEIDLRHYYDGVPASAPEARAVTELFNLMAELP